jgi:hypothetical protein
VQTKEPQNLRGKILQEGEIQIQKPQDFRGAQNNLKIHAKYHNYNNVKSHKLGVKYCAIDTKYKILKS